MLNAYDTPEDEIVPPECRSTVARVQSVLDGDTAPDALVADPHPLACPSCRERVRAARVLLSVLAAPAEPVALPVGFTDRVLTAVTADRRVQTRARVTRVAALFALAAAVIVGVWFIAGREAMPDQPKPTETVQQPAVPPAEVAPAPHEKPPAPVDRVAESQPMRFNEAVATTGQAIFDTPTPFTESVAVAPKVFDVLTGPFKMAAPPADPMGAALAPARKSLEEIPVAARAGLEPVTATAEKALSRFLRDMGSVKPNS